MAADLGLHFYRFSISWPRLLPTGFPNYISEDGKKYYNNLINGLLAAGIEPVVTIYHWELPQTLQDLGGWTNPLISDWFADYARAVFTLYADRVKTWITLNEPLVFCDAAYGLGAAPGVVSPEIGNFLCNKYALIAHAIAWRIYDQEFRHKHHGKVAMANTITWFEPDDGVDEEVAELVRQFGIYPEGIRRQMKWLYDQYGEMEIMIVENEFATNDPKLHDLDHVEFFNDHLEQILLSIYEDGINVTAFTAWSLTDNYQWIDGYYSKFGLYAVDFEDLQRKRTPRTLTYYYASVIRNHSLITAPIYSPYTRDASEKNPISDMATILTFVCEFFMNNSFI